MTIKNKLAWVAVLAALGASPALAATAHHRAAHVSRAAAPKAAYGAVRRPAPNASVDYFSRAYQESQGETLGTHLP
jgi:hypothetical protein